MLNGANNAGDAAPQSAIGGEATGANAADDLFIESILGSSADQSPVTGDSGKGNTATSTNADDVTKRYEYWQSKADTFQSELDRIKPLAEEYNRFAPVVEYLKQNPDAFEEIAQRKSGVQRQSKAADTLQEPVAPIRPSNYDPYATDPASESFKYRIAKEEYTHQLTEYMFAKQKLAEQDSIRREQSMRQAQAAQQKIGQLQQELVAKFGFTKEAAADFVNVMDQPESMSLQNMINLYKVIKHQTKNGAVARNNAANNSFMPPPPPTSGGGGGSSAAPSDEDSFFGGIADFGRRSV